MAKVVAGGKKLVIVESPTKAKTIKKFLGKDYIVESCMGHIRDLPKTAKDVPEKYKKQKWARLGVDVENEFEPLYCIPNDKKKIVSTLKDKMEQAQELYLATDEDREGESISWHLLEVLKPKIPVKRMVFHEITEEAIQASLKNTRKIDDNLVRAQEARRILDRLVGFSLSPLIWKKVAYGLSAGRVQSVALRLVSERELSRFKFKKALYCGVENELEKAKQNFTSKLSQFDGKRIATGKDFDQETGEVPKDKQSQILVLDDKTAQKIVDGLKGKKLKVESVDERPISREPYAPFITSSLQQDASRKFGWPSRQTMRTAQELYEKGFITYMRTDSVNLSEQAIKAARDSVKKLYGDKFLSKEVRTFKGKKVKGAQEAHEAIRPSGSKFVDPDESGLSGDAYKLYDLIWKRTLACQMANSQQRQVQIKLSHEKSIFSSSGTVIEFQGFLKVYEEATDDQNQEEETLPVLKAGEMIDIVSSKKTEHETKPPSRFTEAGLIQVLEKEGIGRPSTYASTISTIVDRGYVSRQGNTLIPTFTALIVSKLLSNYFPEYVDLKFTAGMEENLDEIAEGNLDWVTYLKSIYMGKTGLRSMVEKQEKIIDADEARSMNVQGLEMLSFRVGRYGAYVCRKNGKEEQCASLPESRPPSEITEAFANELIDQKINGADSLGKDPKTGLPIYVLTGRYGPYVQLGDNEDNKDPEKKPKRTSIPPHIPMDTVDMEKALLFLSLPKTLGQHTESQKDIKLGIGRFGPYIVCDGDYRSIPKTEDFFAVDLNKALEMLAQPKKGRGGRGSSVIKELGEHDGDKLQIMTGKYGPYIKWGKKNVSLPEGQKPEDFTMEKAIELLGESEGGSKSAGKGKKAKKISSKKSPINKVDLQVTKVIAKGASKKAKASKAPVVAKKKMTSKTKTQKRV
ncbi:MAG: type I DNA topoisomerase [Bdellovibrionota bacterium]